MTERKGKNNSRDAGPPMIQEVHGRLEARKAAQINHPQLGTLKISRICNAKRANWG